MPALRTEATMNRSPCAGCRHSHRSKVKCPCRTCKLPAEYADSLEPGPECRADPSYRMDYVTPAAIARQLGSTPISGWDLIASF